MRKRAEASAPSLCPRSRVWAIKRAGSRLSKGAGEAKLKRATIAKLPEARSARQERAK